MPVSRNAEVVRRALKSVLAQDLEDFEVLVGDETGAAESAIAEVGDPRVMYQHNPSRLGFSKNHGSLLDRASGRYMAVLHDDDWWEPNYLSSLVAVLNADPDIGMAFCATLIEDDSAGTSDWPVPVVEGRHDNFIDVLLLEEWFLLPISTMWRGDLWTGPARLWPDLCCGDLQLFLSIADAGWDAYFLAEPLAHWVQHSGQSGAWRGSDNGLGVANDVLAFWDGWLEGRPEAQVSRVNRQRARWYVRQARALLLSGHSSDARFAVGRAADIAKMSGLDRHQLPGLQKLSLASRLPGPVVRAGVGVKRAVLEGSVGRRITSLKPISKVGTG
jgi:hypothetical protein